MFKDQDSSNFTGGLDKGGGLESVEYGKCFEKTFEEVLFTEENEHFWDRCNMITCFTRKEWISRLPKIMIVHLKRFDINNYGEQQINNKSTVFDAV